MNKRKIAIFSGLITVLLGLVLSSAYSEGRRPVNPRVMRDPKYLLKKDNSWMGAQDFDDLQATRIGVNSPVDSGASVYIVADGTTSGTTPWAIVDSDGKVLVKVGGDGNVGIGNPNPMTLLNIGTGTPSTTPYGIQFGSDGEANLYRSAAGRIQTNGSIHAGSFRAVDGYDTAGWLLYQSGTAFFLRDKVNSVMQMHFVPGGGNTGTMNIAGNMVINGTIDTTIVGKVGIGTESPNTNTKLDVQGLGSFTSGVSLLTGTSIYWADQTVTLGENAGEVNVQDSSGNKTLLSPHNDEGEWIYYCENLYTGEVLEVDMERLVAEVEALSGKTFTKRSILPASEKVDFVQVQDRVQKKALEKQWIADNTYTRASIWEGEKDELIVPTKKEITKGMKNYKYDPAKARKLPGWLVDKIGLPEVYRR